MSDEPRDDTAADPIGIGEAIVAMLSSKDTEIALLREEKRELRWIIGAARQMLDEGAPDRALKFLVYQEGLLHERR